MSDVAVVIPCHDCAATVDRALASVSRQTELPTEVVMVDDGSDVQTRDHLLALASRPWPFLCSVQRLLVNSGPADARNAGWDAVSDRVAFVAFLDADDWWLPRKLESQRRWLMRHHDYDWCAHRCVVAPYNQVDSLACDTPPDATGFRSLRRNDLLLRNLVATPTVMLRSSIRLRFRSGWRACEDLMLWADLLDAGHHGAMLEETLASLGRRPGAPGGLTGDARRMHEGEQRVIRTLRAERRLSPGRASVYLVARWARHVLRRLGT